MTHTLDQTRPTAHSSHTRTHQSHSVTPHPVIPRTLTHYHSPIPSTHSLAPLSPQQYLLTIALNHTCSLTQSKHARIRSIHSRRHSPTSLAFLLTCSLTSVDHSLTRSPTPLRSLAQSLSLILSIAVSLPRSVCRKIPVTISLAVSRTQSVAISVAASR